MTTKLQKDSAVPDASPSLNGKTDQFPRSPSEINPAVMTDLVGQGRLGDNRIRDTKASLLADGRGYLGQIARIAVAYDGPTSLPPTYIAKFGSSGGQSRETAAQVGMYRREIGFYQELAPKLEVSIPKLWAVRSDSSFLDHVILLEDVDTVDSDQIEGCSPEDAASVLKTIAHLHAQTWLDPWLRNCEWIPKLATPSRIDNLTRLARNGWAKVRSISGDLIGGREALLGAQLSDLVPEALERLDAMHWCLLHGDLRLDNILFRPGGSEPVLIDWQGLSIGPAILDVGYFLIQSLATRDRQAHLRELLDLYLHHLGTFGVAAPASEELYVGLRSAAIFSLVVACSVPVLDKAGDPRAMNLSRAMLERSLSAYFEFSSPN